MDHITGKIRPEERTAGRPITAAYEEGSSKGRNTTALSGNAMEDQEDKPKTGGQDSKRR